jgi:hypothetical protein
MSTSGGLVDLDTTDDTPAVQALFVSLKAALPELQKLLRECGGEWGYEDPIYRFYHQSFKVYALGNTTKRIVSALQALAPEQPLNEWFVRIVSEGTDKTFDHEHNARWLEVTRPIVEAFFHARYFLEMAVTYGRSYGTAAHAAERVGRLSSPLPPPLSRATPPCDNHFAVVREEGLAGGDDAAGGGGAD